MYILGYQPSIGWDLRAGDGARGHGGVGFVGNGSSYERTDTGYANPPAGYRPPSGRTLVFLIFTKLSRT